MKGTFNMDEDKIKKLTDYYKNDGNYTAYWE